MNPAALIEQMETYLLSRGIRVSSKPFQARSTSAGGLVKLEGRTLVVLDSMAPPVERLMVLAEALCSLDYEPALLPSEVRRAVKKASAKRSWRHRRLVVKLGLTKPPWLQSQLVSRSPGLRACKGNVRT